MQREKQTYYRGFGSLLIGILILGYLSNTSLSITIWIQDSLLSLIFLAFLWVFLTLIRNTKDSNTTYLKIGLIIISGFLLTKLFLFPFFNLSIYEFTLGYLSVVRLYFLVGDPDKSLKKRIQSYFWSIIVCFIISLHFFMIYREAPNLNFSQEFGGYLQNSNSSSSIDVNGEYLLIKQGKQSSRYNLPLNKNLVFQVGDSIELSYLSSITHQEHYLLLSDQFANSLKIFPQTKLQIGFKEDGLSYKRRSGKTLFFTNKQHSDDINIINLQNVFAQERSNFILNQLPLVTRNSALYQKISYKYTQYLANLLPFYKENFKNAKIYQYFLTEKKAKNINITPFSGNIIDQNIIKMSMGKTKIFNDQFYGILTLFSQIFGE